MTECFQKIVYESHHMQSFHSKHKFNSKAQVVLIVAYFIAGQPDPNEDNVKIIGTIVSSL